MSINDKNKTVKYYRKTKLKTVISAFFCVTFRMGVPEDQKRLRAHEIRQIVQTRTLNGEHIYLTMV